MVRYICCDDDRIIWGIGDTRDEAWEDAKTHANRPMNLTTIPATEELYQDVLSAGHVPWEKRDGIAESNL